jgi:hypothetical protein
MVGGSPGKRISQQRKVLLLSYRMIDLFAQYPNRQLMKYSFIALFVASSFSVSAQNDNPEMPESRVSVNNFTSQFLISTDLKSMYINIVGAGLRYKRNHSIFSVTIFPSLSFREDSPEPGEEKKPFVRPGFALGPLFQYKRFMIGLPTFYQDDNWHFTAGVGVKFGK